MTEDEARSVAEGLCAQGETIVCVDFVKNYANLGRDLWRVSLLRSYEVRGDENLELWTALVDDATGKVEWV